MVYNILLSDTFFPALMLLIAAGSFIVNIWIAKKSNERFKKEAMDAKLDEVDFIQYKSDHEKKHNDEHSDLIYIRDRIDKIFDYLLK